MFGGANFWNTASFNFDEVFSKENLTVDDLLDEDNVLLEVKNSNDKLVKFFTKNRDHFEKLLRYVIEQPDIDQDHKHCHKFPYIASEIFACENSTLLDAFFYDWNYVETKTQEAKHADAGDGEQPNLQSPTNKESAGAEDFTMKGSHSGDAHDIPFNTEMFDKFMGYLSTKDVLDETLTGYFHKVLNALMSHRVTDVIKYVFDKEGVRQNLLYHVRTRAVADIIAKIVAGRATIYDRMSDPVKEEERVNLTKDLIVKGIANGATEDDNKTISSSCFALVQALTLSPAEFLLKLKAGLLNDEVFNHLWGNWAHKGNKHLIKATTQALDSLLHIQASSESYEDPDQPNNDVKQKKEVTALEQAFAKKIAENFAVVRDVIQAEETKNFPSTWGQEARPFGLHKVEVIKFISKLFQSTNEEIQDAIVKSQLLEVLLDLVKTYEWNNLLHHSVYNIVDYIITKGSTEQKKALFTGAKIVDRIKESTADTQFKFPTENKTTTTHGYFGYLLKIAQLIKSREAELKDYLGEDWTQLYDTTLKTFLEKETQELGKPAQTAPKFDYEREEDHDRVDNKDYEPDSLEGQFNKWKNDFKDESEKKNDFGDFNSFDFKSHQPENQGGEQKPATQNNWSDWNFENSPGKTGEQKEESPKKEETQAAQSEQKPAEVETKAENPPQEQKPQE